MIDGILDLFFPRFCFHCYQRIPSKTPGFICKTCFKAIVFNHGACCPCCGRAMGTEKSSVCSNCIELKPYFKQGISLFAFTGVGRDFIHTLKYHNGTYLKKDLLQLLDHEKDRLTDLQQACFIPVPLHFIRQWKRGYNQSELIAETLAKHCKGSYVSILRRKVNTQSQTSLTREERKKNVEHAFKLRVKAIDPKMTYVLVDDVFTTGATLNACACVLHQASAQDIRVFTLAHG